MTFTDIATQIIKRSIKSAVCIDDVFAEPYEKAEGRIRTDMPEKLYRSFRENGHCSLDFYRFRSKEHWEANSNVVLANKDLIVLDWELEEEEKIKYQNTLPVLETIVKNGTNQFVVIYTHVPDLDEIIFNIQAFYSQTNVSTKETDIKKIIECYEEIGETFGDLKHFTTKLISKNQIFDHQFKLLEILRNIGVEGKEFGKFLPKWRALLAGKSDDEILEFLCLEFYQLRDIVSNISRKIHINQDEPKILNINNTVILLSKKSEDGENGEKILPENLFERFSRALVQKPNNAMSLMASDLKDTFRSNISIIGSNIPKINEQAFYHHWNNLRAEDDVTIEEADEQFRNFLLQTWTNELSQFTMQSSLNSDFLEALMIYGKENDLFGVNDTPKDELIKLGAHYSTINSNLSDRPNKKIQFGDIFTKKEKSDLIREVFLSITPHCDAIRPSKINNLLHFVHGYVLTEGGDIKRALENSETDFYSFLSINDVPICIKWKPKPFTLFISDENNDISTLIEVNHKGTKFSLKHLTLLKENYTQRIANHSFSHAMRVGITLPSLKN